ncbi:MAG TPA: NAD(P)H-dependent oxidoreductase subunit E [Thermodesulfovibrionales bacterium]|nr:NAD(P)H-dependent oxidoreductase subunit E [Thermodesulfovibrionales bacterium]
MTVDEINIDEEIGEISKILSDHERNKGILVHALQQIQKDNSYLPGDVLRKLSINLGIPLAEIYSVASFYKMFHFKPRGKKIVKVCLGTACYVRGSKRLLNALETEFQINSGETTEDLAMTLETVGCVGCCGLAPVSTIDDEVIGEIIGEKRINNLICLVKA